MEPLAVSLSLLLVVLLLLYRFLTAKFNYFSKKGIPGPRPIPIFGTLWGAWNWMLGEEDLANVKKYGKVFGTFDGRTPHLIISDPELIRRVLVKDFNHFRNNWFRNEAEVVRKNMLSAKDEEWKKVRSVMTPTFTISKLKKLVPVLERKTVEFVDYLKKKPTKTKLHLQTEFTSFLLGMIAEIGFGIDVDALHNQDHPLIYHAQKMFSAEGTDNLMALLPIIFSEYITMDSSFFPEVSRKYLSGLCYQIIKDRRNLPPRGDFVDLLFDAADEERKQAKSPDDIIMTDEVIAAQILVFLIAGFVTTYVISSYTVYEMACHPEMQQKLYEEVMSKTEDCKEGITTEMLSELPYLDMFFNEVLRYYPTDYRIERICTDPIDLNGIKIDRGVYVSVPIFGIHRNEEFYPEPLKFDPERFSPESKAKRDPYTFLAFGAGPRNCIGMRFANIVVKLAIVHLIKEFHFYRTKDTQVPVEPIRGTSVMMVPKPIYVGYEQRNA